MPARFSDRTPDDLRPNRLSETRAELGEPELDLTRSNPTRCGLPYPEDLLRELAGPRGLVDRPDPMGLRVAREAIADRYRANGHPVTADQVCLTSSTSEAYSFLFKLLGDPGDRLLVPAPSYPLLGQLARLDGLVPVRYRLAPEDDWGPDTTAIEGAPSNTRALVVVHPNNPTGSMIRRDDGSRLATLCRDRGWALIADEVFLPFRLASAEVFVPSFSAGGPCLGFALGGLSKSIGLPQAKLAWIVITGPEDDARAAAERLEYVADAYLSVSGPVAHAASWLLERGQAVQRAILSRCGMNLHRLRELVGGVPEVDLYVPVAGWSAVVRVPAVLDDEELAVQLLEQRGVAVHPGDLFDFPDDGYLVLSLLPEPSIFAEGIRRLLSFVGELVKRDT